MALEKPNGGVRPIAVGEAVYRLIGRVLLASDPVTSMQAASIYVGETQYGVGVPGGVEIPVHAIRELHRAGTLRALASFDVRNAYNSIDRVAVAYQIARRAPAWARLYEWSYRHDSALVLPWAYAAAGLSGSLLSKAGVRQGDVLGPLFFAVGMAPILDAVALVPGSQAWAYLDDVNVAVLEGLDEAGERAQDLVTFSRVSKMWRRVWA